MAFTPPPPKVGRKVVSTRPVLMLYAASWAWFTVVVLPEALLVIEVKPPAMNTRLPTTSMSQISPPEMRGVLVRGLTGTRDVWPGRGWSTAEAGDAVSMLTAVMVDTARIPAETALTERCRTCIERAPTLPRTQMSTWPPWPTASQ